MREIILDAAGWRTPPEFYGALKRVLGAPEDHGDSPDDFVDSMIWGGSNDVEAPYKIRILNAAAPPKDVQAEIAMMARVLADARLWRRDQEGTDVGVRILIGAEEAH